MNEKALLEQRQDLHDEMETILNTAKAENRVMNENEVAKFDELEQSIKNIDATLERKEKLDNMEEKEIKVENKVELTQEEKDIKAFANIIRVSNDVTATQLTKGDNGTVIPSSIVKKIVDKVAEISPIYARATKYSAKGTLVIPKVDTTTDDVTVDYATEFSELVERSNKFASVTLTGFLAGSLVKVSKSLLNNSDFNLTEYVIDRMAEKFAAFIEKEGINGTTNKISGIVGSYDDTNMKVTLANKSSVGADELIDLQEKVPDVYQANACWIYVDISGLAIKEAESMDIQVLLEKFATQHAIGVCGYSEIDAKVENTQKIAVAVSGTTDAA